MRMVRVVLALLAAVALAGCIFVPGRHVSGGGSVNFGSDGHSGGPPPGRGWKK